MDDFLLGDCQQVVLRLKYPLIDGILKTNSIGCTDVVFDVDVVFDFCSSHVSAPFVRYRKWNKKSRCLSEASFGSSHFLYRTNGNPAGATTPGSPFWHPFLAKQKGM
ncbi:hypothetical protein [Undibacterium umbellatum]|uniref:Uncharacterized protein n=1 Tax=Undibacterium umbellatum TaxID=2762300 RepID=A0ABR6ZA45_9BURK|nr:hypothetical protein [Undibacterium umbellatum]MBC3908631.1 hypothetical protein [Undibacterium umbellatum]